MTRPLYRLTLAYTAGISAGHLWRPVPGLPLAAGLVALGVAAKGLAGPRARPWAGRALLAVAFSAGALAATLVWRHLGPGPLDALEGAAKWARVAGRVASEPRPTGTGYSFFLRATEAGRYWRAGETVYVKVRRPEATGPLGTVAGPAEPPVDPGDWVLAQGFLERPRPPGNPGEFDFGRYLATFGVRYTLAARGEPAPLGPAGTFLTGLAALCRGARDRLTGSLAAGLPPDRASLLGGLLFGDTSRLPEEIARDFRRSGVFHILAVSGSNVAFVAGGFWFAARPLLSLAGRRGARAERVLRPATALVLAAYAVMAGLGPSVSRATLMAEAGLAYLWLGRRRDVTGPLCLAALLMLSRRPLLILDVGFQLSFAATLGLLFVYPPLRDKVKGMGPLFDAALVSVAAQSAVVPILAWHFGEVSLAGLLANAVVVPLSGLAVTTGLAAGILGLAGLPGRVASVPVFAATSLLLKGTTAAAHLFSRVPAASVIVGSPPPWIAAAYYLALAWVVAGAREGRATRRLTVVALGGLMLAAGALAGRAVSPAAPRVSSAEVTFLDVGQGDAIFVSLPGGRSLLIDGGPAGAGERVLGPFLRHRGEGRLDAVVVSHFHDDHLGGLSELLADPSIGVGEVVLASGHPTGEELSPSASAFFASVAARKIPVRTVAAGDGLKLRSGAIVLAVLGPSRPAVGADTPGLSPTSRENNSSLVLRVTVGPAAFLLPGDLERDGEEALLAGGAFGVGRNGLPCAVLKVAHHGSPYATGASFLAAVRPAVAVISVGPNSFGHPSPDTEARLRQAGATIFRTDADGAVIFRVTGQTLTGRGFGSGRRVRLALAGGREEQGESRRAENQPGAPAPYSPHGMLPCGAPGEGLACGTRKRPSPTLSNRTRVLCPASI